MPTSMSNAQMAPSTGSNTTAENEKRTLMAANELQLASLLCSRICHDLISPVGAIANGLEVMEDDKDEEMREHAMALIQASATQASAKLQFARMAFGAGGAINDRIDMTEAREVSAGMLSGGKVTLKWSDHAEALEKETVKLLLNLLLVGADAIPRGGDLHVNCPTSKDLKSLSIIARGTKAKVPDEIQSAFSNEIDWDTVTARSIQPHFARLIARNLGVRISVETGDDVVTIALQAL